MSKRKTETAPKPAASNAAVADDNSAQMCIPARPEWVRVVRLATAGVAARLGFSYDEVEDLKLAVAEACNNAILHGSGDKAAAAKPGSETTSLVTVRWAILPDRLRISVSDQGRLPLSGLPILPNLDPSTPGTHEDALENLPEGGMGLLLIQTLMDEVEQESGPNSDTTLHMVKYAPRAPSPRSTPRSAAASAPAASSSTADVEAGAAVSPADTHALRAASTGVRR
jgi:serine/threonine-protein kinase RsbW